MKVRRASPAATVRFALAVDSVLAAGVPGCVIGEVQQSLDQTNATLVLIQEDLIALRTSTERVSAMDTEIALMQEELAPWELAASSGQACLAG